MSSVQLRDRRARSAIPESSSDPIKPSFSCVTISTSDAGLLIEPLADARKNLRQSQHEMLAAGYEHERLRLIGDFEKPPGQAYRNDIAFISAPRR